MILHKETETKCPFFQALVNHLCFNKNEWYSIRRRKRVTHQCKNKHFKKMINKNEWYSIRRRKHIFKRLSVKSFNLHKNEWYSIRRRKPSQISTNFSRVSLSNKNEWYSIRRRKPNVHFFKLWLIIFALIRMNDTP